MTLTLPQLADVCRSVAREHRIEADVVGVVGEGGAGYAEVLVELPPGDRRVSIGLVRYRAIDDLRREIAENLVAAL